MKAEPTLADRGACADASNCAEKRLSGFTRATAGSNIVSEAGEPELLLLLKLGVCCGIDFGLKNCSDTCGCEACAVGPWMGC